MEDQFLLSSEEEFKIYERHENSIDDPRYVDFFMKFINSAIVDYIKVDAVECLDFGSGPEPVLAKLLEREFDWSVDIYDKFYATSKDYQDNRYDLVTSTEVVEHLRDPMHYFHLFKNLLKPFGILSIMTLFHPAENANFSKWLYTSDPSHISFYTPKTMKTIAEKVGLNILFCDDYRYVTFSNSCPP